MTPRGMGRVVSDSSGRGADRRRLVVRSWVSAVWLAVCVAGVVGACTPSGGAGQPTATKSAATTSPTSSTVVTSSAPVTATGTATSMLPYPIDVPAAARTHDAAGAEAFVTFYVEQVNRAWAQPSTGLLPPLSLAACKSCEQYEGSARDLVESGQRFAANAVIQRTVASVAAAAEHARVLFVGQQPPTKVVDRQGATVRVQTSMALKLEFSLSWAGAWRVAEVTLISPGPS